MITELEKAEAKLFKQRQKVAALKRARLRADSKTRNTALFAMGACFEAALAEPKTRNLALEIWKSLLSRSAPEVLNNTRRDAIAVVFGL